MKKNALLWLLSFLLTIVLAVYQRLSGPTYPIRGTETLAGSKISYEFYRSWTSGKGLPVRITISGDHRNALLFHRRYPLIADDNWSVCPMAKNGPVYTAVIPTEPPAGKVIYKVRVFNGASDLWLHQGQPAVARFKSDVPMMLLIVHVIFMFAGLLLGIRTGLEAFNKNGKLENLVFLTLAVIFFGGLILGPLVQYYAFGALWTGFPLGEDLTDNKTFLVVVCWIAAFFLQKKGRGWVIAAALLMVLVYLIPHSLLGSELDYKSQQVRTGYYRNSAKFAPEPGSG
jgi:hypothetical protein